MGLQGDPKFYLVSIDAAFVLEAFCLNYKTLSLIYPSYP